MPAARQHGGWCSRRDRQYDRVLPQEGTPTVEPLRPRRILAGHDGLAIERHAHPINSPTSRTSRHLPVPEHRRASDASHSGEQARQGAKGEITCFQDRVHGKGYSLRADPEDQDPKLGHGLNNAVGCRWFPLMRELPSLQEPPQGEQRNGSISENDGLPGPDRHDTIRSEPCGFHDFVHGHAVVFPVAGDYEHAGEYHGEWQVEINRGASSGLAREGDAPSEPAILARTASMPTPRPDMLVTRSAVEKPWPEHQVESLGVRHRRDLGFVADARGRVRRRSADTTAPPLHAECH